MLGKKKMLLFYLVLASMIILNEFSQTSEEIYQKPQKPILSLDTQSLDAYTRKHSADENLNTFWGIPLESKKTNVVKTDENQTKTMDIKKTPGQNQICIEESCYRLVGIHKEANRFYATLYNKESNESLKSYTLGDNLKSKIKIANITTNSVKLEDLNSKDTWYFKIFDVNQTKYRPKEIKH